MYVNPIHQILEAHSFAVSKTLLWPRPFALERTMDTELKLVCAVGRSLPPLPHATALINRVLKPIYLRKARPTVIANVWGMKMRLDPKEAVDGGLLFYPQLYNRTEMRWLEEHVRPNDVFADVGAYIGAFSLRAACLTKQVIAIEANPDAFAVLEENIRLNRLSVKAYNIGVSDKHEKLKLYIQDRKNAGGSSFVVRHAGAFREVDCRSLSEIAAHIDVMKIDIEGMEYKVLGPYFQTCCPRIIVLEAWGETDALRLCLDHGYQIEDRSEENVLLKRTDRAVSFAGPS
uniref:FkbM family methyltransferase n=1 Tax=Altererythrobacter segetis TaxID=1104773 RepID=UPI00140D8E24|nr:FkbM family methyltransferase [Altererythrobacter segetis]